MLARKYFWEYCKARAPEFYKEDRWHLKKLCNILQDLYEGKLKRKDGTIYKKVMINLPPQHGKTRTLVLFCEWVFGKNTKERIISTSYNDTTASDFSRYTRDGIAQEGISEFDIVYSDIFPETKIKDGNASFEKWALEGEHFNYLGAGIGGSITSKGGTILLVDDPIKNDTEALNENHLEKVYRWYTNTFLSRVSAEGGEPIEIIVMTRWSKNDICGRILSGPAKNEWYVLKMEAYNEVKDEMLCPALFNKNRYKLLKSMMLEEIFLANYHQKPIDLRGRLYKSFKTYSKLPYNKHGHLLFETIRAYIDTADQGSDYLCCIIYGVYQNEAYILDVYYTKAGMEITEPETAKRLYEYDVKIVDVESNAGGRGFARNVESILNKQYKSRACRINWFHQSENKIARIISASTFVMDHIYYPVNWSDKWPEYYNSMSTFQKEGKNKNDDAQDATSGIAETISGTKKRFLVGRA